MLYCPVCKSRNIFAVAGGYIGQIYLCKDCGYRGSFVLETDEESESSSARERTITAGNSAQTGEPVCMKHACTRNSRTIR